MEIIGSPMNIVLFNVKVVSKTAFFLYKENPVLDTGFNECYAFDQKSSKS